jgi:hypothetical protein
MRQIHTMAKKARRASWFRSMGAKDTPFGSRFEVRKYFKALRRDKRSHLQPRRPKTFGEQVGRIQRIQKGHDQFGNPKYILVPHAPNV